nr:MAG TPA: hypothetical protein [Caudoviricetes sp.]
MLTHSLFYYPNNLKTYKPKAYEKTIVLYYEKKSSFLF